MSASSAFLHNWRLKLSALGLAIFLWALVQTEPRNQETFPSVPIHIEVADTMWTTSGSPSPATVELRLGGPAREIIRLAREGPTLRVPIETIGSQDTIVALRREWVELGERAGVVVESVSPAAVRLTFEPAVTRLVPVSMRVRGRVPQQLALANEVAVNPQLVRVRGPESRLIGLDSVRLLSFDLDRAMTSGMYTVAVDTSGLAGASVVPPTATLNIQVDELVQRVLDEMVVYAEVASGEAEVVPDPVAVQLTLSGARTVVNSLDPAVLRVRVAPELLLGMEPGEERRVRVHVEGVPQLVTAIPGTEVVTVRRAIDLVGSEEDRNEP